MSFDYAKHIQTFFASAGANGCNAFCIIRLANKYLQDHKEGEWNELDALKDGIERKFIDFNEKDFSDGNNFYVRDGAALLSYLTGRKCTLRRESAEYQLKQNEHEIQFWALSQEKADRGIGHFTIPGENTLQVSNTVKNGKVYSKRIYTIS